MPDYICFYQSPLGVLEIAGSSQGISSIHYTNEDMNPAGNLIPASDLPQNMLIKDHIPLDARDLFYGCIEELNRYFEGSRKSFSIKLFLQGTEFQKKVWNEIQKIPYGYTASYKEIATAIGNEKATRAVGNANHRNKIPIIIPCHRVIGGNGLLTGYAGNLWRKKWLLEHEKKHNARAIKILIQGVY